MTPDEAKKAFEKYGSIRAASIATGVPRTTFRRKLNASKRVDEFQVHKKEVPNFSYIKNKNLVNLFLPDIHSPYHDEQALKIAIQYAQENYNVTDVTYGGDFTDFYQISRFVKNKLERMPFFEEIEYNVDLLKQLKSVFPACNFRFIKGNHEDRFDRYLMQNASDLIGLKGYSIQEQLELDSLGIEYIDNIKRLEEKGVPYSIGELHYLHGHEIPGAGVYAARNKFLKVQKNIIFGHHHTTQHYPQRCFDEVRAAWAVGCLCTITPTYLPVNAHLQGFAIITHEDNGRFTVENKMIIDGRVH